MESRGHTEELTCDLSVAAMKRGGWWHVTEGCGRCDTVMREPLHRRLSPTVAVATGVKVVIY
jgi:uncharacterized membrane protein